MIVKDVIDFLNDYAPLAYAEEFDNAGLIVGNENNKNREHMTIKHDFSEFFMKPIFSTKLK